MTVLPIVARELAVAARRPATYRLRSWAAAAILVVFCFLHFTGTNATTNTGHAILNALGVITLGLSMFAGLFLTADSLSSEKREGTLGLLFLTDLKGYDVVLGKLAANSLLAFFGLLAVFPVLALPLLIGGVSGAEFWRLLLVFLVTMFASLSVGIFVSSATTDARQALGGTFLWLVISAGILPVLWWMSPRLLAGSPWDWLLWPSPAYAYMSGFDARYITAFGPHDFWCSLAVILASGLAALTAASVILPRSWQQEPSSAPKPKTASAGLFSKPRSVRPKLATLDHNPFHWLALHGGGVNRHMTIMLYIFVPIWAFFLLESLDGKKSHVPTLICCFIAIGLHAVAKVLLAAESGRRFNHDRQTGALELLLVTPLSVSSILDGQSRGLGQTWKGSLWALGLVNAAMAAWVLGFPKLLDMQWDDQEVFIELFIGGLVVLILDYKALTWVGMWRGLITRNHPRAVLRTVVQILAPLWLFMFLMLVIEPRFGPGNSGVMRTFALWFAIGIMIDIISIAWAKQQLATRFRAVVSNTEG